ncbi:MAG: dihydrofolate reductase [Pseudomonadota bacterium]
MSAAGDPHCVMVVATARGGVIGKDGALPWRAPSDLKWFRRITMGKPVVMGRKTYRSIGKALPGRTNIVLTRSEDFAADGALIVRCVDEASAVAIEAARAADQPEYCVIGGAEVYAAFSPQTHRIYLTEIDLDVDGDARFPDLDPSEWSRREVDDPPEPHPRDAAPMRFFVLERREPLVGVDKIETSAATGL